MKVVVRDDSKSPGSADKIISFLDAAKNGFLSGEELSHSLGVSRTAVWKQIKALRAEGYDISAEPSRGYRLLSCPDRLRAAAISGQLQVNRVGTRILSLDAVDSTNVMAFGMAEAGEAEGTVVIADSQGSGKGRLGRKWASPPGVNLYCSVILRPQIQPMAAPQLTFLSVVAVARAVENISGIAPRIKWPNDLLVEGKKIAGLLNEMSAETDKVNFVILGIGVNLNMTAEQFPDEIRHPATSLLIETGQRVDRTLFAATLLQELDRLYTVFLAEGYGPVRSEWLDRSRLHGEMVTVSDNGSVKKGRVIGIDQYGALILDSGEQILSGDVVIGG